MGLCRYLKAAGVEGSYSDDESQTPESQGGGCEPHTAGPRDRKARPCPGRNTIPATPCWSTPHVRLSGKHDKALKKERQEYQHIPMRERSSEPDSDTRQSLELSAREFKITIISKGFNRESGSHERSDGNSSREMESLRKNHAERLELKNPL